MKSSNIRRTTGLYMGMSCVVSLMIFAIGESEVPSWYISIMHLLLLCGLPVTLIVEHLTTGSKETFTPQTDLVESGFPVATGDKFDIQEMREELEALEFRCVDIVSEKGDFSVRGSIMDIFPKASKRPYRIELFDDEIESIRTFQPETQTSLEVLNKIYLFTSIQIEKSAEDKPELEHLHSFCKVGYGGIGGAVFDQYLHTDGIKLYGTVGAANSWLYLFSNIPGIAIFVEIFNFLISLTRTNLAPNLFDSDELRGARMQIDLTEIEFIKTVHRGNATSIFCKISLFFPLIGLFAVFLQRSRVTLYLSNRKKIKVDFFSVEDAHNFQAIILLISNATNLVAEPSLRREIADYIFTGMTFFILQVGLLMLIWTHTVEFFADPVSFFQSDIELLVTISLGFWVPLFVKLLDQRLTWQTNYRYASIGGYSNIQQSLKNRQD